MPQLIRFMLVHLGNGVVLGLILAELVLAADLFQLSRLVQGDDNGLMVTFLIFLQSGLLFGTANMGVAVMNLR